MPYDVPSQHQTRRDQDLYLSLRIYALTTPTVLSCRSRHARDRHRAGEDHSCRATTSTASNPKFSISGCSVLLTTGPSAQRISISGPKIDPLHSTSNCPTGCHRHDLKRPYDQTLTNTLRPAYHSTPPRTPKLAAIPHHHTARCRVIPFTRRRLHNPISSILLLLLSIAILQFDYTEGCSRRAPLKARAPLGFNITEALQNPNYRPTSHPTPSEVPISPSHYPPQDGEARNETLPKISHPNTQHTKSRCNSTKDCGTNFYCVAGTCECKAHYSGPHCSYSLPGRDEAVKEAGVTSGIVVAILFAFAVIFVLYLFLQSRKRSLHHKSALAVQEIAVLKASYDLHGGKSSTLSNNAYAINPQQVTMGSVPDIFRAKFYDADPEHRVAPGVVTNQYRPSGPFKHLEPFKATFEELLNSIALVSYKSGSIFKSRVSIALRGSNRSRASLVPGNKERRKSSHTLGPRDDDRSLIPLAPSTTPQDDDHETTFSPNLVKPHTNFE